MRMTLLVTAIASLACGHHESTPAERQGAMPAGAHVVSPVEHAELIPARYPAVAWFPGEFAPILQNAETMHGAPSCLKAVKAQVEGYLQATGLAPDQNILVFVGKLDRKQVEACLQAFGPIMVGELTLHADGPITELTTADGKHAYLGWTLAGEAIWNRDRTLVQEVLDRKTSITSNARLMSLFRRLEPDGHIWEVAAIDLAGLMVGVPSQGFVVSGDLAKHQMATRVVFASPADAIRAVEAFAKLPTDTRFSPALRAALAVMHPKQTGSDVELDVLPVLEPSLLQEVSKLMEVALTHYPQSGSAGGH